MTKDQFDEAVEQALGDQHQIYVQLYSDGTLLVSGVFANIEQMEKLTALYKQYEEEAQCPF
jgi:hypothetical protein